MQLPDEFTMTACGFAGQLYVAVRYGCIYHVRDAKLSFAESESRVEYGSWTPQEVETFIQNGTWRMVEHHDEPDLPDVCLEEVL